MATSGSVDFGINAEEICTAALRKTQVVKNDTPAALRSHLDVAMQELNLMVKAWMADGLQLWTRKRATLFLELNKATYSLGPTGDHATESSVETSLTADAAASATNLTVDDITGISNGDNIGVVLDDGNIHWDTVNGAPAGSTVVITTGLASAASDGLAVYTYTTKIDRPLRIIEITRRDSTDNDIWVNQISLNEYNEQTKKTNDGKVLHTTYDPQLTDGLLYVWPRSDTVTDTLEFWYHRPFEDFDNLSDDPDFPQEWYLALVYGLASLLADTYNVESRLASRLEKRAVKYKDLAMEFDTEPVSLFLQPDTDRANWN